MIRETIIQGSVLYKAGRAILGSSCSVDKAIKLEQWLVDNKDKLPQYEAPDFISQALELYALEQLEQLEQAA